MIVNKKIKFFLLFLTLILGTQSMQAYWFESITKPIFENKITAIMPFSTLVMSFSSLVLGCTCYFLWMKNIEMSKELKKKNQKNNIFSKSFPRTNHTIISKNNVLKERSPQLKKQKPSTNDSKENLSLNTKLLSIEMLLSLGLDSEESDENITTQTYTSIESDQKLDEIEELLAEALGEESDEAGNGIELLYKKPVDINSHWRDIKPFNKAN